MQKTPSEMLANRPIRNKEFSGAEYSHVSRLAEMFTITPGYKPFSENQIWFRRSDIKSHDLKK